jgi:acetyl-CoA synthetase
LTDYAAARQAFRWADAEAKLARLPGGGLNIAHEAVDRHVSDGRGATVALRWLSRRSGDVLSIRT